MPSIDARLQTLRRLAIILDQKFTLPGTPVKFGYEALIGLLPGIGDAIGGLLSACIIFESARLGISRTALIRMVGNVLIEVAAGAIPLLGDFLDVAWKANMRNVQILDRQLARNEPSLQPPLRRLLEAAALFALTCCFSAVFGLFGLALALRVLGVL